jgi:hypothetical protein
MLKLKFLIAIATIVLTGIVSPASAQVSSPTTAERRAQTQAQPTSKEILEACVQNRAETLPNPYTDVSPDHWAYKAVLTMYYCGAYRQATPPSLIKRLTEENPAQQS